MQKKLPFLAALVVAFFVDRFDCNFQNRILAQLAGLMSRKAVYWPTKKAQSGL